MLRLACLLCLIIPRLLLAQLMGLSLGRVSSTVAWEYPRPAGACDLCVSGTTPNASRESFAPALMVEERPSSVFGLASEIRYTLKGYATTEPTLNVHYLEVPALLRVGRIQGTRFPILPFLELGPALAIRVYCEVDYNQTSEDCRKGAAFGQDWRIRRLDISAVAGLGLTLHVDDHVAMVGARYDAGLLDVGGGNGATTKHRSTLVYLAWLWSTQAPTR